MFLGYGLGGLLLILVVGFDCCFWLGCLVC